MQKVSLFVLKDGITVGNIQCTWEESLMKRLPAVCLLLFVVLIPAASHSLLIFEVPHKTASVIVEGEQVQLNNSSLATLREDFNTYDFSYLPFEKRLELYEQADLSLGGPALENLIFGFGKGSRQQGDTAAYLFGELSDRGTLSVIGVGVGLLLVDQFLVHLFGDQQTERGLFCSSDPLSQLSLYTMAIGGGTFLLGRCIQALLPVSYGLRYNRTLRRGLDISSDLTDRVSVGISLYRKEGTEACMQVGGVVGL